MLVRLVTDVRPPAALRASQGKRELGPGRRRSHAYRVDASRARHGALRPFESNPSDADECEEARALRRSPGRATRRPRASAGRTCASLRCANPRSMVEAAEAAVPRLRRSSDPPRNPCVTDQTSWSQFDNQLWVRGCTRADGHSGGWAGPSRARRATRRAVCDLGDGCVSGRAAGQSSVVGPQLANSHHSCNTCGSIHARDAEPTRPSLA